MRNPPPPQGTAGCITEDQDSRPASSRLTDSQPLVLRYAAIALGLFTLSVLLCASRIADGDLWAKLAIGAFVLLRGELPRHDLFAFTPVLPQYIDHEWGSGVIFFTVLKLVGPAGLMALKIFLFAGALGWACATARTYRVGWSTLLLMVVPCGWAVLPGYIPTLRSHTFTYCAFAAVLFCLERLRQSKPAWPAACGLVGIFWLWSNLHGGFVAGLGALGLYTLEAILLRRSVKMMTGLAVASFLVTFINPYGLDFWRYLIPAILHPRARIVEWQPLSFPQLDAFLGFHVLYLLVALALLLAWKWPPRISWAGLALLFITAFLGWRSRRHCPFLGIAALAYASPYVEQLLAAAWHRLVRPAAADPSPSSNLTPSLDTKNFGLAVLAVHGLLAAFVFTKYLPNASFQVLAPVGHDPVREADILSRARVTGNLAVPFGWGSYASWRLYPKIKISNDGRYEAVYPESTFEMNNDFFDKRGADWDRLLRQHKVDFVVLDFQHELLRPEDLRDHGYEVIWLQEGISALLARGEHVPTLHKAVAELPPTTINPLDPDIPKAWWRQ